MPCGAYPNNPIDYILNGRFIDFMVCTFGDQIGVGVTMLLFFGITFLVMREATNSTIVPVAVLIVIAPLVVAQLPAVGLQWLFIVVFVMLAIAGMILFRASEPIR